METRSTNALTSVVETTSPLPVVTYSAPAAEQVQNEEAQTAIPTAEPVSAEAVVTEPAQDTSAMVTPMPDYAVDNPDTEPVSMTVQAEDADMFVDPVPDMTVLYGYSGDTLMYNEILGDWRTHDGIDIEADIGCSVNAAAGGTVSFAGESTFGGTVIIDHENGFSTVYSQLGEILVSEGDSVSQNTVIGSVGESKGETTQGAHLHYEIHKDGEAVDPMEY